MSSYSSLEFPKLVCVHFDYLIFKGLELLKRIYELGFLKRRSSNDLNSAELKILNDLSFYFLSTNRHNVAVGRL